MLVGCGACGDPSCVTFERAECQIWLQACNITQNGISQSGCPLWCWLLHALLSVKTLLILRVVVFRGYNCYVSDLKSSLCLKILLRAYHFIFSVLNMVSFHCLWSWKYCVTQFKGCFSLPRRATIEEVEGDVCELESKLDKVSTTHGKCCLIVHLFSCVTWQLCRL